MRRCARLVLTLIGGACTSAPPDVFGVHPERLTPEAVAPHETRDAVAEAHPQNVLIIVVDDVGNDKIGAYGEHPAPAPTPNIDALAAAGVRFTNAYANPTCSASRASLLTGRHAARTGIGRWINPWNSRSDLPLAELTIPEMLRQGPLDYSSAAIGKWHLVTYLRPDARIHPMRQGFERHRGTLSNPVQVYQQTETEVDYYHWEKSTDGTLSWSDTYLTVDTTDEALLAMTELPEPWFIYVAYNAAHEPLHAPPDELLASPLGADASGPELFDAMVEAVDTEIGRLLAALPEDTMVFFTSDNGTEGEGVVPPSEPDRAKGTTFEGGINVPLIVSGPRVRSPGSVSDALVHLVDLFPTVAGIAGVRPSALVFEEGEHTGQTVTLDGIDLLPWIEDPALPGPRSVLYTDAFFPNGDTERSWRHQVARDADFKLVRIEQDGVIVNTELFALGAVDEGEPLDIDTGGPGDKVRLAMARLEAEVDRMGIIPFGE